MWRNWRFYDAVADVRKGLMLAASVDDEQVSLQLIHCKELPCD
jgi:hypothetical protein